MLARARYRREQGQTMVVFAIFMALLLFAVIAFVADLSVMYSSNTKAHAAALVAADSGANDLDLNALANSGVIRLKSGAEQVCEKNGNKVLNLPSGTSCTQTGAGRITATSSVNVNLPVPIFGISVIVHATVSACPVYGTATAINSVC